VIFIIIIALISTLLGVGIIVGLAVMADRIDERLRAEKEGYHENER